MTTEENKIEETKTEESAVLSLQKVYLKDVSFENPNAPEVFTEASGQPRVEMNLALNSRPLNDEQWEVALKVNVVTRDQESEKVMFEIEVEQAGIFFIKNIPEEHMTQVLAVNCPSIIFPYTRQIMSQLTVDGGFMPFLMEPVNFQGLLERSLEEASEAEGQTIQ
ncbi:MAG: protein-export chaperone SecB [Mariprofundaceae bacterium]|nr:protein-export chaperone SecB [Mariprofundaceae bacterium]